MSAATISVVMPALDEEGRVGDAVRSVRDDAEVIVVDGGSTDGTRTEATAAGAAVITSERGRGAQLAAGARAARGEWLVFLHADTRLEEGWARALRGAAGRGRGRGVPLRARPAASRLPVARGRRRSCGAASSACPTATRASSPAARPISAIGGFRPLPLMEDVDLVRRLGRAGPLAFPAVRAFTSARRFERRGLLATSLRNLWLLGLYSAGRAPERLARLYRGRELDPPERARY